MFTCLMYSTAHILFMQYHIIKYDKIFASSRTLGLKKEVEEFALLFLVFDENESW